MKRYLNIILYLLPGLALFAGNPNDQYKLAINLAGSWKFMIGDGTDRASTTFNDNDWESIGVPSSWENQGFPGYNGFAWYRKQVTIPSALKTSPLVLSLGYIDDVDEVYFNGVKIGGKGSFPPNFWTAYNAERKYAIPAELVKFDQFNTIAVRVYDSQIEGGIVSGQVGIYARIRDLVPDVDLEGYWKFSTGDNMAWLSPQFDDSNWGSIVVPGNWEDQVSSTYDGFGWYRKQFKAPAAEASRRYVLVVGKIDDLDEVYVNGRLVGRTGTIYEKTSHIKLNWEFNSERIYYLNAEDIVPAKVNTIAIRVYDGGGEGGIYTGTVGLVEIRKFVAYWRGRNR